MNISSVVVNVDEKYIDVVKESISILDGCEVVASNQAKVVALINAENLDDELAKFKNIEKLKHVVSVVMVYSYQEDIEDALSQNAINSFLDDDSLDAKNVKYSGDIYRNI